MMHALRRATIAATMLVGLLPGAAAANTLTFDLSCGRGGIACDARSLPDAARFTARPTSVIVTAGIHALKVSARSYPAPEGSGDGDMDLPIPALADGRIGRFRGGAGVFAAPGDDPSLDGLGLRDLLELRFDSDVRLTGLAFSMVNDAKGRRGRSSDGLDGVRLIADLDGDGAIGAADFLSENLAAAHSVRLGDGLPVSRVWGVTASRAGDDVMLRTVKVETAMPLGLPFHPSSQLAAVPLPASAWLMVFALGGLIGLRRTTVSSRVGNKRSPSD